MPEPQPPSRVPGSLEGWAGGRATLAAPGVCPSGQRERAVNPSAQPTEVRILPPPSSVVIATTGRLEAVAGATGSEPLQRLRVDCFCPGASGPDQVGLARNEDALNVGLQHEVR